MTTPGYDPGSQSGYGQYPPVPGYPVKFSVEYPETLSRGLIFIKWLLIIPHFFVLFFLAIAMSIVTVIAWFAILFTGKFPRGLFDFNVGVMRWYNRASVYYYLMRDEYPPFTLDDV